MSSMTRRSLLSGPRAPASPDPAFHICSLVVHARPDALAPVGEALRAMAGVEIHGESPKGKIVVTVETTNDDDIVRTMGCIADLPGVLSTALIYQHSEPSR
jgi:periplasmic nitrate reductase NapD